MKEEENYELFNLQGKLVYNEKTGQLEEEIKEEDPKTERRLKRVKFAQSKKDSKF